LASSVPDTNIQLVKLGLNYKWGTNPLLWGDAAPVASVVVRDATVQNWLAAKRDLWSTQAQLHSAQARLEELGGKDMA